MAGVVLGRKITAKMDPDRGDAMDQDPPEAGRGAPGGASRQQDAGRGVSSVAEDFLATAAKEVNMSFAPRVVLPGDRVTQDVNHGQLIKLGNGLQVLEEEVVASKAGMLRYRPPQRYHVDNYQRRYIPKAEDTVLGVVEDRGAEQYRVNIFGSFPGLLPHLAFEGATKRNKPALKVGSLVYCRIAVANKDMDPELSCIVTQGIKKDWMTGEATFGELKGGAVTRCSLGLCRQLSAPNPVVLEALSQLPFETAIGINGAFWVKAADVKTTAAITNAIVNSEFLGEKEIKSMCDQVMKTITK